MRYALFLLVLLLGSTVHAVSIDERIIRSLETATEVPVIIVMKEKGNSVHSAEGFRKEKDFGSVGSFSGRITRGGLERILKNPNVIGVQLDKPVKLLLSESAPLINASNLWPLLVNNTNITGVGETVCIIDTGIDYNHSALGGGFGNRVLAGYNYCANDLCTQENSDPFDNNGHGTHVAGIIASNDSVYRGIAPNASLVAIKVLNSAGTGTDSDVIAGINWCIANSTAYNISVISMSLGGDILYTGNCDGNETAYSAAINAALAKNISVIIASGNDASNISMSAPACIQNATSVGAVYDANVGPVSFSSCSDSTTTADKISCFTNRNILLDLFAPGSRITSANDGGGFVTLDGTSMATPHVAAAFALLRQYKRMENGTLLGPGEIENILKSAGKNISDPGTGLTFPRISLLAALISIDTANPLLSLASPQNRTYNTTNITLNYSASDSVSVGTCSFTNMTGSTIVLTGCSNTTFIATANQQSNITVSINDSAGNANSTQVFFTVDTIVPFLNITSPKNTTYNVSNVTINYSASDVRIDRCWFTNTSGSDTFLNNPRGGCFNSSLSITEDAQYNITVYANDTGGNVNYTTVYFTADLPPQLSVQSPSNKTYSTTNVSVNYTTSDFDSCWLTNITGQNTALPGCSNTTISAAPNALNNITILSNDSNGNTNSVTIFFTVDTISPLVNFTSPTPNNETLGTTNSLTINATISELPSAVLLEWNETNITMNGSGTQWFYRHENLSDGNYSFRIMANDTAGNVNVTSFRWVFINATRNVTSYIQQLNTSLAAEGVGVSLLNETGLAAVDAVFVGVNYTLRFNITGIVAEISNFSWLQANTSNLVNVTRNITVANISSAVNTSGGILDNYIWIDVGNFTSNYTPKIYFNGAFRLSYYLNGSKENPDYARINETCNENSSNLPCYLISNVTTIRLASFSGAAVGNDTQPPALSISSPSGTYSSSNVSLDYSVSDNVAPDVCWHSLNSGGNTTINGCTNTTIIAASGSNTIILYANDTSGNANSSTVTFTYTPPAPPSSSGGGGGGASISVPVKTIRKSWSFISGSANVAVSFDSIPVKSIIISVAAANSPSIAISPETSGPAGLQDVYQYFSINATNLGQILSAEMTLAINRSWVETHNYDKNKVALNRFNMTWSELPTRLVSENSTHLTYISDSPGFSYFAITGQKFEAVPELPEGAEEISEDKPVCIQVITPAVRNGECINYPTPCDVPEDWTIVDECPVPSSQSTPVSLALAFLTVLILCALSLKFMPRKRKKSR